MRGFPRDETLLSTRKVRLLAPGWDALQKIDALNRNREAHTVDCRNGATVLIRMTLGNPRFHARAQGA